MIFLLNSGQKKNCPNFDLKKINFLFLYFVKFLFFYFYFFDFSAKFRAKKKIVPILKIPKVNELEPAFSIYYILSLAYLSKHHMLFLKPPHSGLYIYLYSPVISTIH